MDNTIIKSNSSNKNIDYIIELIGGLKLIVINVNSGRGQCQLRCKYCFLDKDQSDTKITSYEDIVAFKNIIDMYPNNANIQIFGTEPLLQPELIEQVHNLWPDKQIYITSNGIQLNENMISLLERNNAIVSILSFDGPYQDQNRPLLGGGPTHDILLRSIGLIPEHMRKRMTLRATVRPGQRLVPIYEEGLKFNVGSITPIHDVENSNFTAEEVMDTIIELAEYFKFKMPPTKLYIQQINKINTGSSNGRFCPILGGQLALNPGGNVSQCQHGQDYTILFNVHSPEELFYDNINKLIDKKNQLVHLTDVYDKCKQCQAKNFCPSPGQCPSQFETTTHDLQIPNESYCNVQNGLYQGFQYWQSKQNIVRVEE